MKEKDPVIKERWLVRRKMLKKVQSIQTQCKELQLNKVIYKIVWTRGYEQ